MSQQHPSSPDHPLVAAWLHHLRNQGKQPTTVANYRRGLAHFLRWLRLTANAPFEPTAILPRHIVAWRSHQQRVEQASPGAINQRRAAVSSFFKWAAARDHLPTDPTAGVGGVPHPPRRPRALSRRDTHRLPRQVRLSGPARDVALIEVLLGAGLRVGELLALRRRDVQLGQRPGRLVVRYGKGGGYRTLPLTRPVRQALHNYLALQLHLDADNHLWQGERGPLQDRSSVNYLLKKYARLAGLDPRQVTPHVLRHTFATLYLERNPGDLRGLAALLGHANLNTVLLYTVPSTETLAHRLETAALDEGP